MDLSLEEVFEVVRSAVSSDAIPPEEVTMESHLYFDLELSSVDFMGMVATIKSSFKISLPLDYWDIVEIDALENEDSWETYRHTTTASLKEYLDKLKFSGDARTRVQEIEEFCRRYNVKPFTVGCVCACILHIAENSVS